MADIFFNHVPFGQNILQIADDPVEHYSQKIFVETDRFGIQGNVASERVCNHKIYIIAGLRIDDDNEPDFRNAFQVLNGVQNLGYPLPD